MTKSNKNVLIVFRLFVSVFLFVTGYLLLIGLQVYKMDCSHSKGYCYIQQYSLSKLAFVPRLRVPLTDIKGLYADKNKEALRIFLQTIKGDLPIETIYTNFNKYNRMQRVALFQNWLNNKSEDNYAYQESRMPAYFSLTVFLFVLVFFVGRYLKNKSSAKYDNNNDDFVKRNKSQEDQSVQRKAPSKLDMLIHLLFSFERSPYVDDFIETYNPAQEEKNKRINLILFGIIMSVFCSFVCFLFGLAGLLVTENPYQTSCSHSLGFCEIAQYNLSERDYIVQKKVPINMIQDVYLHKKQKKVFDENNQPKTINVRRMHLATIKGYVPVESEYTNVNGKYRLKHIKLFKQWHNGQAGDKFIYKEKRGCGDFIYGFFVTGFVFLIVAFLIPIIFRKKNTQA